MDIEFDPAKDARNRARHGLSLAFGPKVLANVVGEIVQWVEGEERFLAFGLVDVRLFVCVYTMRGATHRIISVRKADPREERQWLS